MPDHQIPQGKINDKANIIRQRNLLCNEHQLSSLNKNEHEQSKAISFEFAEQAQSFLVRNLNNRVVC